MFDTHECIGDTMSIRVAYEYKELRGLLENLRVARDLGNKDLAEDLIRKIFLIVGLQP